VGVLPRARGSGEGGQQPHRLPVQRRQPRQPQQQRLRQRSDHQGLQGFVQLLGLLRPHAALQEGLREGEGGRQGGNRFDDRADRPNRLLQRTPPSPSRVNQLKRLRFGALRFHRRAS